MPKRSSKSDLQPDYQQRARKVPDAVVPDAVQTEKPQPPAKNPAAVELGKLGGKKGGPARAKKLSAAKRSEIAKKAAEARWKPKKQSTAK
jgi:hypothetical protein